MAKSSFEEGSSKNTGIGPRFHMKDVPYVTINVTPFNLSYTFPPVPICLCIQYIIDYE